MSDYKENEYMVEVKNLKKYFDIPLGFFKTAKLKAVDDISFSFVKEKRWAGW